MFVSSDESVLRSPATDKNNCSFCNESLRELSHDIRSKYNCSEINIDVENRRKLKNYSSMEHNYTCQTHCDCGYMGSILTADGQQDLNLQLRITVPAATHAPIIEKQNTNILTVPQNRSSFPAVFLFNA